MKKIVIFILLACLSSVTQAQQFQVGIKGGANLSNFAGGNFSDVKKKGLLGFHAGGYFQFRLGRFALQSEALLSTQGAVIDSVSGSYNWKVTYVQVPVLLQFYFRKRFYLEAGPQVAFKTDEQIENSTLSQFAKDLDLSLAGGLGYRSRGGFGIGIRYITGISKVGDFQPSSGIDPDFRNAVLQGSLYIPLARAGKK